MSHAVGKVRFNDGLIMYFDFCGTGDACCSALYDTLDEMLEHYREHLNNNCKCRGAEEVVIFTYYYPSYWKGSACRKCRAILSGTTPYEGDERNPDRPTDGIPDWASNSIEDEDE